MRDRMIDRGNCLGRAIGDEFEFRRIGDDVAGRVNARDIRRHGDLVDHDLVSLVTQIEPPGFERTKIGQEADGHDQIMRGDAEDFAGRILVTDCVQKSFVDTMCFDDLTAGIAQFNATFFQFLDGRFVRAKFRAMDHRHVAGNILNVTPNRPPSRRRRRSRHPCRGNSQLAWRNNGRRCPRVRPLRAHQGASVRKLRRRHRRSRIC